MASNTRIQEAVEEVYGNGIERALEVFRRDQEVHGRAFTVSQVVGWVMASPLCPVPQDVTLDELEKTLTRQVSRRLDSGGNSRMSTQEAHKPNVSDLLKLAQDGDVEAQFLMGSRYYVGSGANQDFAAAAEWFARAASEGHARAQFNLGYMHSAGEGLDVDRAAAIKWYTKAANQGLPDAQANLAILYENNNQFAEAASWYRRAADLGFASAQASLAFALSQGRGVPIDEAAAVKYYRLAAEQGFTPAQFNLGFMYAQGRGAPLDPASAVHWVRLAANQGFGPAQYILGDFYAQGFGVAADSEEAAQWFLRAAVQGISDAQNRLANQYAVGDGVSEDRVLAYMWFAVAASQGDPDASERKDQVPIDRETAIYKMISAAAAGDAEAQRDLAIRLNAGDGIQQDPDAAHYWLRRAAEAGDAWSQTTYALRLDRSDEERVQWLTRAAEQGDYRALFNLGLHQFLGESPAADPETAAVNLITSSLGGIEEARGAIENIKPAVPEDRWSVIFERVKWPDLMFIMGPLVEGHLDAIRTSQENDDGSDDAEWLSYEREAANLTFLGAKDDEGSLLDAAFSEKVTIKQIHVGRAHTGGKVLAAITINLRNIHSADGFPVFWKPSKEGLDAVASLISLMEGRTGVRWNFVSF